MANSPRSPFLLIALVVMAMCCIGLAVVGALYVLGVMP